MPYTLEAVFPQSLCASDGKMIFMSLSVGSLRSQLATGEACDCDVDYSPTSDRLLVVPDFITRTGNHAKQRNRGWVIHDEVPRSVVEIDLVEDGPSCAKVSSTLSTPLTRDLPGACASTSVLGAPSSPHTNFDSDTPTIFSPPEALTPASTSSSHFCLDVCLCGLVVGRRRPAS